MPVAILAFAVGCAAVQFLGRLPDPGLLGGLAALGLLGAVLSRGGGRRTRACGLFCLGLAAGLTWAAARAHWRLADELPAAWEARELRLTGVVAGLPQRFERGERFAFAVESVEPPEAAVPDRLLLSWYRSWDELEDSEIAGESGAPRALKPGERWRLTVRLKRPHGNANPGGFDYEAWLFERGFRATGSIVRRAVNERLADFVWRPGFAIERLRHALRERFVAALPQAPGGGVLIALAIGDQRAIPAAQWQLFNRTGITHLVSISGLHVTMLAALAAAAVGALWRRSERLSLRCPAQRAALAAGALAALAYALLAGFEVPAQRTLFMLGAMALAVGSGRHYAAPRVLVLALGAVLLLDPWAVLSVGFWLSFVAVGWLLYATTDAAPGWRGALARWGTAQWAVTLGGLPLLLFFFQQFSLVSPLANALAIPLVSLVVTPLALLFVVLPWEPLLRVDHALVMALIDGLEWLARWPTWQQPAPPLWSALLALAGALVLLLPRGFPARWLGACLFLPALAWTPPRPAPGAARIDLLDVGQGLAVVVRTASRNLLYDAGPLYGSEADAGLRVVLPFLRAEGVGRLDALVISHRDKDHSGGASSVLANLPVERLLSSLPELGGRRSEACVGGQSWTWDGVRFSILHPPAAAYGRVPRNTNSMSCVLRVESASGDAVLLTGDIEAADEAALLAGGRGELGAAVIVVPHHGGKGSSTPDFIAAVAPRHALFSAGYRNAFGHPRPAVESRYAQSIGWRSDRDGAIRVGLPASVGAGPALSAWRREYRRYWHAR